MDVREKLLHAALRVFEEAGSRGATTRRIAGEAGVNEVTLFRHFGSKAALLTEALQCAASRDPASVLPETPRDPAAELAEWCRVHLAHLRRSRSVIRTCMGEFEQAPEMAGCVGEAPARAADELHDYLLRLRERGLAAAEFDARAAAAMLMGALFSDAMGRDIMPDRFGYAPEEAPAKLVPLFLRAIGAAPGPRAERGEAADPTLTQASDR
ncbi:MAG TPA: helix-turn-helix domain-containing protein [Longimicrobiaceae bacterium]|nr:helix-turn-helix domain-containing protein [Longimicrobiaceae bacterium]